MTIGALLCYKMSTLNYSYCQIGKSITKHHQVVSQSKTYLIDSWLGTISASGFDLCPTQTPDIEVMEYQLIPTELPP